MEKRVIAAIVISIAILFAFRYYEDRRLAKMPAQRPPASRTAPGASPAPVTPVAEAKAAPPAVPVESLPAEESAPERKIVVDCALYRAVLDSHGAVLTSWELKRYRSSKGEVFQMIPEEGPNKLPYPGSIAFDDPALGTLANSQNYAVEILNARGDENSLSAPATVVMRLRRGDLLIEKRFEFEAANYLVRVTMKLQRGFDPIRGRLVLGQDIGPESEHLLNPSITLMAVSDLGGRIQRDAGPKDEKEIKSVTGDVLWAGLDMQYFAEIAIPAKAIPSFQIQRFPVKTKDLSGQEISRDLIQLSLPADGTADYRLYIGPKKQADLSAVPGAELSGVIDFGTYLGVLVKPLLSALRWIDQYVNNFGVSIILLTFALTLVLFPFRLKQMVSMKKMQVLQPKIKEIQERYKRYKKTDPKRAEMNQEVMAVYKEHNVNPLGGCLPLLLQMPILFAFYRLLTISIELRQAPFFGWLHDLSAKDPYYILPIIMGITMLISQKMTPMSPGTDPVQAKMMLIMPVVFTFMFLNVSAGLNLYFLCSNVFQIAFQKVAERWVGDQQPERKSRS
jgi:YidC/Oxa1 family membrane protein insertase